MTLLSGHGGGLPPAWACSKKRANSDLDQAEDSNYSGTAINVGLPSYLRCRSVPSMMTQAPTMRRCRPRLWVENPSPASATASVSTGIKRSRPYRGRYDSDDENDDSSDDEDLLIGHPPRPTKKHKRNHHSKNCRSSSGRCLRISVVTFSRPLVTAVHTRPRTARKDKSALYYCQADQARFRRDYREYMRTQGPAQDGTTSEEKEKDEGLVPSKSAVLPVTSPTTDASPSEEKKRDEELPRETAASVTAATPTITSVKTSTHEGGSSEITDSSASSSNEEEESDESSCSSSSSQSDEEESS